MKLRTAKEYSDDMHDALVGAKVKEVRYYKQDGFCPDGVVIIFDNGMCVIGEDGEYGDSVLVYNKFVEEEFPKLE